MAEKPANQPPLRLAGPQKNDKQVRDAARIVIAHRGKALRELGDR